MREGWRPPPLNNRQANRLLDDIARIGGDGRRTLELTAHEQRVLEMVSEGCSAGEIAGRLGKSRHTVISYQKQIRRKLGARTLAHAVAISLRPSRASS